MKEYICILDNTNNIESKPPNKRPYRWLRRILRILAGILLFLFLVILFIRSPWGQDIIVNKVVNYVSDKTNTEVKIDKLFVTFGGNVQLNGLYLEDKKGDTLIYSKSLEADIPLWKTITGKAVGVDNLYWDGVKANIIRKDSVSGFNFQFLMNAFATTDTTKVKDTTNTKPLDIIIGDLNLTDFNIKYNDAVTGIDSNFKIGLLEAEMETTDLENMIFEASDIVFSDSNIKVIQNSLSNDTTTTETSLPKFTVGSISINNVKTYFKSKPNGIIADATIRDFYAEEPNIDLTKQSFKLETIELKNSKISLNINSETSETSKDEPKTSASEPFEWPKINVEVSEIDFEKNNFQYTLNNTVPKENAFNPNAIKLNDFTLLAEDIFIKEKAASINIEEFQFKEYSGLNLKQLSGKIALTDTKASIESLNLQLNNNAIEGYAVIDYNNLQQFLDNPEVARVNANLPNFSIALNDLFKFQPELQKNQYLKTLSQRQITGRVNASGTLAEVNIPNLEVQWGSTTKITANGKLKNTTNPNKIQFDLPQYSVVTKKSDVAQFISESETSINLPQDIKLSGSITGSPNNISTDSKLNTSQGIATIEGNFTNTDNIAYNAEVEIKEYKINELLNNPQFGELSMTLNSNGKGKTINTLNAELDVKISKFNLNNYAIRDLNINGNVKNGTGRLKSDYKDENLNLKLDGLVILDSISPEVTAELDVVGADLQALGLMQRNVKTGMDLFVNFKGNSDAYNVTALIEDGVVVYDNQTYLLGSLDALGYVSKDTTSVYVSNKMLDINLKSNTDPQTFSKSIRRHILSYFYRDETVPDTISNPVNLKLEGKIAQSPLLNDVFLVNVEDLDTIDISVDFNEKARTLKANVTAPHINYSGNELDSLAFSINTDKEDFNFNLGFKNITAGPLDVPRTIISGNQSDNELSLNFHGYDDDETLLHVNTKLTGNRERLRFTVNPDSLVLNKNKWIIPESNEVILTENNLEFNDFKITRNNQSIEITDKLPEITKSHAALEFKNFKISEVLNYLNPETKLATGQLNGDFILEEPFGQTGIVANLNVSQLEVLKTDLGTLTIDAKSLGGSSYDFNAALKQGKVDLDLTGDYVATEETANLNLGLDINSFQMEALNTLSLGEIKEGKGSFNGHFDVTGTAKEPKYQGQLNFNSAEFKIAKLNTIFKLRDETLEANNEGISMSNFTVRDVNNNKLVLSGEIGTEKLLNPTFDLDLEANNFQVLDAKQENNEMFYGKATFDADAKLTGDLQIPKLDAEITIGSDTDFVYVLPSSVASIEERDGVVRFVNKENPNAILTQTEEQTATIKGFDISTLVKVGKEAAVTIVIDEETGDNFKVSGEGDFDLTMSPNGRINLSGVYEISDGHYELNLYNLVNRKFLLAEGSRVSWSGDPFDAKLDVRAIYKLETSASPLMAPQISGADPSVKTKYRQVLPFNVYLNIDGELLQPKISFGLDMPEEEQGAIGGQVYGRVQQVNQQEGELNRQVFSLLVLNRFYPDPGSDGSTGGFATIARDNLNDAVSEQLNAFSDKILGDTGIELDFGLDSYTDYQGDAPTERTQLDVAAQKKLFNDRLTVRVGSEVDIQGSNPNGETTPLIGNVSLEYTLTEDGRYRLKGFRRNEFENVIDGQTIVSGIALIFTQEFNHFDELWDAIFRSVEEKEAKRKAAEEKIEKREEETTESMEKKKN